MKISAIKSNNYLKAALLSVPIACAPLLTNGQKVAEQDKFVKTIKIENIDSRYSIEEMSPALTLGKDTVYPALVLDLKNKRMYEYYYDTEIKDIHKIDSSKQASKKLVGINVIKEIKQNEQNSASIILQEVDVLSGKPINESIKVITNSKEQFAKSKNAIFTETEALNEIVEMLEPNQYIWIK